MSLNSFHAASLLIQSMRDGVQYVRVVSGPRLGSICRVLNVRSKYYSAHDYQLEIKGRRSFWAKGSELEHLRFYVGDTHYAFDRQQPTYNDLMGRQIEIGHTILFPRGTEGARVDMVMGTVHKISGKGAIYARLFKNSQGGELVDGLVRVGKPCSAMILDKGTVDQVMLAKLSSL